MHSDSLSVCLWALNTFDCRNANLTTSDLGNKTFAGSTIFILTGNPFLNSINVHFPKDSLVYTDFSELSYLCDTKPNNPLFTYSNGTNRSALRVNIYCQSKTC